jgi:hypothetical protein
VIAAAASSEQKYSIMQQFTEVVAFQYSTEQALMITVMQRCVHKLSETTTSEVQAAAAGLYAICSTT